MTEPTGRIQTFGAQAEFIRCGTEPWEDYLYKLYHGGVGSGKTAAAAICTLRYMAEWGGSLGVLIVPIIDTFNDTVLPSIREIWGGSARLEEGRDWHYVATRREVHLRASRSMLIVKTGEAPTRIRGPNASFIWVEEARDVPYEAFLMGQARLRKPGYPHQGFLTSTPIGQDHWMYPLFYGGEDDAPDYAIGPHRVLGQPGVGRYEAFEGSSRANPFLPPGYVAQLQHTYGTDSAWAQQEIEGRFVRQEGAVYGHVWRPEVHVVSEGEWPVKRPSLVVCGVDFGYEDPAAMAVWGVQDGKLYLLEEFYERHSGDPRLVQVAKGLMSRWGVRYYICDSATPASIRAFREAGLPALKAKKTQVGTIRNPSSGIGLVAYALSKRDHEGRPMVRVSPSCRWFRKEIESYARPDPRIAQNHGELPKQFGDHLMDATRYAFTFIDRHWRIISHDLAPRPRLPHVRETQFAAR